MKKLPLLGLLLIIPSLLNALDIIYLKRSGWYVAGAGSYDWYQNQAIRTDLFITIGGTDFETKTTTDIRPEDNWNGSLGIGYMFDHLRVEVEGIYRPNKEDKTVISTLTAGTASTIITATKFGIVSKYALMVNGYFDLPILCDNAIFYIGAGVGVAFSEIRIEGTLTNTPVSLVAVIPPTTVSFNGNEDECRFAFQFMTGISMEIFCNMALTIGYRLFGTTKPKEQEVFANIPKTNISIDYFQDIKGTPLVNSLELGLRLRL